VLRTKISNSQDWCMYVKGGSAYIRVEGNEIYNCGTGGFVAGQGTGFEWMTSPWIHYEAYGITFVNNVIHDTDTAGMGVNGGYNILFAHNTLVRAGTRDHFFEANGGGRGCDGDAAACASRQSEGGWGGPTQSGQFIPNRNIFVFNNLFYAQASKPVPYMLQIANTYTPPAGSNLTGPQAADTNLQIKGNVFWDGAVTDLGISRRNGGCADTNPTCNVPQLEADNGFNGIEPTFVNLAGNDFHVTNGALNATPTVAWPDFDWSDLPRRPLAPAGQTRITITTNKDGAARTARAGAY
ncbi:right-handed parallel beta-helix repeat-containing protein, partial [Patescibacteria group bacterium]|nr:right-handed parallel beta-helix repeat-containing protein [Patescibacteria group bacterium]